MLLQTAFGWNTNLWRFCETAQNVLQITTKMSQIGKKTREKRKNKSGFVPQGGLACVTQRKILTQPSALMTSSLPRPNVGTHSGRVVMQGGGGRKGAVVVVVVEKKKISGMLVPPWKRTL